MIQRSFLVVLALICGLASAVGQQPSPPPAETRRIVVVGDSLADGMAAGLADALTDLPQLDVQKRIKASSGFVREDLYDWRKVARDLVAEGKLAAVVVLLGSNDRQAMQTPSGRFQPLSDGWRTEYVARVDEFLRILREADVTVYWTGLPPMPGNRVSADMEALNEITRERALAAGAKFIDVWDGFADDDGRYTPVGPDLTGAIRRLRAGDGVHFSRNGNDKLAHYVEEEIRLDFASAGEEAPPPEAPALSSVPPNAGGVPQEPPAQPEPVVAVTATQKPGEVKPLTGIRGEAELLGPARRSPPSVPASLDPKPGRADDMRWPR